MKTATVSILILVGIGMFIGVGYGFCVFTFTGAGEELIDITEEQVNVVEDTFEKIEDGQRVSGGTTVRVYHDNKRNVTCWVSSVGIGAGMSCIPDHMLTP